ncbi:AAA family ATPase [Geobacillus sp. 46C-IIa]|uniref:MrcB family domain-containing protein n=1 Tax=Geobacillus sp. 46C-IIa TaxID=1963025 RepID=UPI0009C17D11|nr:DUF3578 domain-containing protein [Geobacillus sp. 46C-IIa]OQP08139.1 AAA family ATPase [Geobacillus sp. 46C-IIa]QNU26701.1 DUF3578 domain-containing protein [Geobacillus sp. 46C-IIa]
MSLRDLFRQVMAIYEQEKREKLSKERRAFQLMTKAIPEKIKALPFVESDRYIVKGSVGQGVWTDVPWVAVMDQKVTDSTQRGYYIVYLFSEDMCRLYLTLAQGVTETPRDEMERVKRDIHQLIPAGERVRTDDDIRLGENKRAKDYERSVAAYIVYSFDDLPSDEQLARDLEMMIGYYRQYVERTKPAALPEQALSYREAVEHIHSYISAKGFYYTKEEVTNLFLSLKTKPFVILSGISGTGKTKMVQWFAESVGATEDNGRFTFIPVRPDWNDGSDLLGYVDIKGDFKPGPLANVVTEAENHPDKPYFVVLDEMNLARVEHYFSDVLSVMESRRWENGRIISSRLLSKETAGRDFFLPPNVYIIGTVNMDETTHPFSKKVLDRANTIEFNRVRLDHLDFLRDLPTVAPLSIGQEWFAARYLHLKDVYADYPKLIEDVTKQLVEINRILEPLGAHIGYRVRDEICFYLAYNEEGKLMELDKAFDYCLMQKILPRLSGSDARLERALNQLFILCAGFEPDGDYGGALDVSYARYPKSAEKIWHMLRRLEDDGFTSFWLGA